MPRERDQRHGFAVLRQVFGGGEGDEVGIIERRVDVQLREGRQVEARYRAGGAGNCEVQCRLVSNASNKSSIVRPPAAPEAPSRLY